MDVTKQDSSLRKIISKDMTDIIIRLALVAFLVIASLKIFTPFLGLMLWALILAITLFPMHQKLASKLGRMMSAGLLGLFIGAVFLSLAYVIFMTWVDDGVTAMLAQENQSSTE